MRRIRPFTQRPVGARRTARAFVVGVLAAVGSVACYTGGEEFAEEQRSRQNQAVAWADTDSSVPIEIEFETSRGTFAIAVHRDWAPLGAERFLYLVDTGYYDDARFHRVVPDFIVQWGLAGDPALTAEWLNAFIDDDPVVASNTRGRIAFAFTEPGTRSTQIYISVVDNSRLDEQGFAPFGEVVRGMDVVDAIYDGYGEDSGGGVRRGDQSQIITHGNAYLDREFPLLDKLLTARILEGGPQ